MTSTIGISCGCGARLGVPLLQDIVNIAGTTNSILNDLIADDINEVSISPLIKVILNERMNFDQFLIQTIEKYLIMLSVH